MWGTFWGSTPCTRESPRGLLRYFLLGTQKVWIFAILMWGTFVYTFSALGDKKKSTLSDRVFFSRGLDGEPKKLGFCFFCRETNFAHWFCTPNFRSEKATLEAKKSLFHFPRLLCGVKNFYPDFCSKHPLIQSISDCTFTFVLTFDAQFQN